MMEAGIGFAFCGSYCCFDKAIEALQKLSELYGPITPILSENAASKDTRFYKAADFRRRVEAICGRRAITDIVEAEPFGPRIAADLLVIAPCTGNTLAKLAAGITDTAVTMAAKSHLRNDRPVLIAFSTNDGLSASLGNVAAMLKRKNIYFVPFRQDDPVSKPNSLASDFTLIPAAVEAALAGKQLQPVIQ